MNHLFIKLKKKWTQLRLQPIRVFCFHQVSDEFEPETMWECDWTQTDVFKKKILDLKKRYVFISLPQVTEHLKHDRFRLKRFAALTADDGWASIMNIIPWLAEQKIPITLFLNPFYMDGTHYQWRPTERLLTADDVTRIVMRYAPFVTIASHGWTHQSCKKMPFECFMDETRMAEGYLLEMKGKIPYYAFPYGSYNIDCINYLKSHLLVPVMMDGNLNYHGFVIHRECLDEGVIQGADKS